MYSKSELKKYSEAVTTIKSITAVYEQAAASRIKTVAVQVEQIDKFLKEAADAYINIKFGLVAEERNKKHSQKNILTASFRSRQKKGILILISSQEEYFGNLIPNLYRVWKDDLLYSKYDGIILGATGKRLLEKDKLEKSNIVCFDLSDAKPEVSVINQVSSAIVGYEKIIVYFGAYRTVLTQVTDKIDIGNSMTVGQVEKVKKYLFESYNDKILTFFELEVIRALLEKKIYESQIARYAARIKILEIGQVAEKMGQILGDLDRGRVKVRKNLQNKKQLQLFSNVDLWTN